MTDASGRVLTILHLREFCRHLRASVAIELDRPQGGPPALSTQTEHTGTRPPECFLEPDSKTLPYSLMACCQAINSPPVVAYSL